MKKAYILHGCFEEDDYLDRTRPSPSNTDWVPWLQKQLLLKGYLSQTPEMPSPHRPDYQAWEAVFRTYPIDRDTTLIAHSCGCGFLLRLLGENKLCAERLVLVAPWLDLGRTRGDFLDFSLDPALSERVGDIHVLYALDDRKQEVEDAAFLLKETYPGLHLHVFDSGGHFSARELGGNEFPQLLEIATAASGRDANARAPLEVPAGQ